MLYRFLDLFFIVFHTSLTLFNALGWVWKKTRLLNLITLFFTGALWLFLGLIVGTPGYCPLTDWHFDVLEKLGKTGLPNSYIKYLADRLTGFDFNPAFVDAMTLIVFSAALLSSISFNLRDYFIRKRKGASSVNLNL
ncbi:MAG TPA: DUF2784 domain-containing protein [Bacteroidales bacterium]|nr:DUF2784 domain-containing protein [Bacteroidales bacterium]